MAKGQNPVTTKQVALDKLNAFKSDVPNHSMKDKVWQTGLSELFRRILPPDSEHIKVLEGWKSTPKSAVFGGTDYRTKVYNQGDIDIKRIIDQVIAEIDENGVYVPEIPRKEGVLSKFILSDWVTLAGVAFIPAGGCFLLGQRYGDLERELRSMRMQQQRDSITQVLIKSKARVDSINNGLYPAAFYLKAAGRKPLK